QHHSHTTSTLYPYPTLFRSRVLLPRPKAHQAQYPYLGHKSAYSPSRGQWPYHSKNNCVGIRTWVCNVDKIDKRNVPCERLKITLRGKTATHASEHKTLKK